MSTKRNKTLLRTGSSTIDSFKLYSVVLITITEFPSLSNGCSPLPWPFYCSSHLNHPGGWSERVVSSRPRNPSDASDAGAPITIPPTRSL